jgi:hypothetical protein
MSAHYLGKDANGSTVDMKIGDLCLWGRRQIIIDGDEHGINNATSEWCEPDHPEAEWWFTARWEPTEIDDLSDWEAREGWAVVEGSGTDRLGEAREYFERIKRGEPAIEPTKPHPARQPFVGGDPVRGEAATIGHNGDGDYSVGTLDRLAGEITQKSVKPTIQSERVPDFPALANEFRSDADFALYEDLTQRGDKALRRRLFIAARTFVRTAREFPAGFKTACKHLGIKGDNIEAMAIRFLFGLTLDKHAVHDWSCVVKYWREVEPDQQDVEAASERKLSELKTAWRKAKQGEASNAQEAHAAAETGVTDEPPLWDFVADMLTDAEPALVIEAPEHAEAAEQTVGVYLCRRFPDGQRELYRVGLSVKGIREAVRLVEPNLPTERAVLVPSDGGDWREAAQ